MRGDSAARLHFDYREGGAVVAGPLLEQAPHLALALGHRYRTHLPLVNESGWHWRRNLLAPTNHLGALRLAAVAQHGFGSRRHEDLYQLEHFLRRGHIDRMSVPF